MAIERPTDTQHSKVLGHSLVVPAPRLPEGSAGAAVKSTAERGSSSVAGLAEAGSRNASQPHHRHLPRIRARRPSCRCTSSARQWSLWSYAPAARPSASRARRRRYPAGAALPTAVSLCRAVAAPPTATAARGFYGAATRREPPPSGWSRAASPSWPMFGEHAKLGLPCHEPSATRPSFPCVPRRSQ